MTEKIYNILENIKKQKPLIHCITNPISINGCANVILSVGARPIMAEHPREVCEITETSDALMLNIGNITDVRMESIELSNKTAKEKGIPTLLDAVGVACSRLRREYVIDLLGVAVPSVIKGNYSEIAALNDDGYFSSGVDADNTLEVCTVTEAAKELSLKYKTVILATGKTDIVTNGKKTIYIKNGTPELSAVTGTGCMLGSLCAVFMTCTSPLWAVAAACCYFGICGETAQTDKGSGTFMVRLMDKVSTLKKEEIEKYIDMEEG